MTAGKILRALAGTVLVIAFFSISGVQAVLGQLPQAPSVPALPPAPSLQPPTQLPQVPSVQVPSAPAVQVPSAPAAQVPSTPTAPSAPEVRAPSAPTPSVRVPAAPAPAGTSTPPTGQPSRTTSSGLGDRGAAASAGVGVSTRATSARGRAAAKRRQTRLDAPPRTRPELRFRKTVRRLWACSYAVTGTEQRVLALRAGLDGRPARSQAATARILDLTAARVRSAQQLGVRRLREANRADGCAKGEVLPAISRETRSLMTVATAPKLVRLAAIRGSAGVASASSLRDRGAVLGEQASSGRHNESRGGRPGARTASAICRASSSESSPPWLVILGLTILGTIAVALSLLRRPGGTSVTGPSGTAAIDPPPAPLPLRHPPPAREQRLGSHWRSLGDQSGAAETAEPTTLASTAPGPGAQAASDAGAGVGARRIAGVTASAASLLLGLALRTRRRR